jgi:hypothetical protein
MIKSTVSPWAVLFCRATGVISDLASRFGMIQAG